MSRNIVFMMDVDIKGDGRYASSRREAYKYSIDSWRKWCNKNNCELFILNELLLPNDEMGICWQRYYLFDILDSNDVKYDQVLMVDADTIIHPDTPNFFEKTDNKGNIKILWNHVLDEVLGDEAGVNGIICSDVNDPSNKTELDVQGVFIAIGHDPNTSFFGGNLKLDESNYIILDDSNGRFATQTSIEGVFAAGDVADPVYRQAVTSAGSGCMAALDAEKFLEQS